MRSFFVFVVVGALASTSALAAPFGVRMTYFGDPSSSIAVSWNSTDPADNEIHFGTTAALGTTTLVGSADQHVMDDPLGTSFSARLTGLHAGTTYFFKVGHSGALSPDTALTFTTLSNDPCAPVHFVTVGDNRTDNLFGSAGVSSKWQGILADAETVSPSFFVNTGDMVRDGSKAVQWNDLITTSEPTWSKIPSLFTQGNHDGVDGDSAPYNQLFELPRNSATGTEDFYSVDVGPIHFATINSNHTVDTELDTMAAWLDADLAATAQPWKIVFFHKGIYSRGNHHSGEEKDAAGNIGVLNATFVPIFDARHVDLVLNGHSHDYERYVPSRGVDQSFGGTGRTFPAGDNTTIDPTAPLPDGSVATTYVVTGGGGASTTDVPFLDFNCEDGSCSFCTGTNRGCDQAVFDTDHLANAVFLGAQHFTSITVDGDTLTATALQTDGAGIGDTIDTFTIHKASFNAACGSTGEGEGEGSVGEGEGEGSAGEGEGSAAEGEGSAAEGEGSAAEGEGEGAAGSPSGCGCNTVDGTGMFAASLVILVARRRRVR